MASKKFLELQEFSDIELKEELTATMADYQKMKFDHAVAGLDNPLTLRDTRRNIARLKNEIRRREINLMGENELAGRDRIRNRRRKNK